MYRSLARRIAVNTIIFLAVIELTGSAILNFFGVSAADCATGRAGMVVAAIGWSLLNEKDSQAASNDRKAEAEACVEGSNETLRLKTFYPFTFPITAGPGTIVVMLTLSAHASGPALSQNVLSHFGVFLACLLLCALVYVCYAYAPKITRAISPTTAHGILRVIAFILLCIGVQIAWNGLSTLVPALHKG